MLQPLQLKDVSLRYPEEIAELRDFLSITGVAAGSADVLGEIVVRLSRDRSFHRDLMSSIWVLIERSRGQIRYADLLGILALAAAGPRFASTADEEDAHHLLHFIMESKRALDAEMAAPPPPPRPTIVPRTQSVAEQTLVQSLEEHEPRPVLVPEHSTGRYLVPTAPKHPGTPPPAPNPALETGPGSSSSKRGPLILAACLLVAIALAGLWLYRRPTGNTATADTPPAATSAPLATHVEEAPVASTETPTPERTPEVTSPYRVAPHKAPARSVQPTPRSNDTPSTRAVAEPLPVTAPITRTPESSAPIPAPIATHASPPPTTAAPSIARTTVAPKSSAPLSSTALSKMLGARTPAPYAPDDITADNRKYPHLLHRNTTFHGTDPGLLAENTPPGNPTNVMHSSTTPAGTVRPTSLGMMAANILYAPTPAYPSAAAAAHIQGEVKIQADIDRNGNVANARVVSGPPLLREAALEAVQHWRYKPRMAGGKPMPASDVAMVSFDLQ